MVSRPTVFVVDDDPQIREVLTLLVNFLGLHAEAYASAEEFLDAYRDGPGSPRCLILDVRMPGLSGLGLQERLAQMGVKIPIVIITGYADVPMAVRAMSAGAVGFIEKPFNRQTLIERISEAMDRDALFRREQAKQADGAARLAKLSQRERQVLKHLVVGEQTKQIAVQLGIGEKTVAKHRTRLLQKMGMDSVVELVHFVLTSRLLSNGSSASPRAEPQSHSA